MNAKRFNSAIVLTIIAIPVLFAAGRLLQGCASVAFFHGKVVDENGLPVDRARIHYSTSAFMAWDSTQSHDGGYSDSSGLFVLSGLDISYVGVSKDGYEWVKQRSSASGRGSVDVRPSGKNPAIFVLRKKGVCDPLFRSTGSFTLRHDGNAVGVSLRERRMREADVGKADFIFKFWKIEADGTPEKQHDCRLQMIIPGGGWAPNTNEFEFTAPDDGYQETMEIYISGSKDRARIFSGEEVFLQLKDQRFARLKISFNAEQAQRINFESYLNPVVERRNLEIDFAKLLGRMP